MLKYLLRGFKMTRRVGGVKGAAQLAKDAPKYAKLMRRLLIDQRVPLWSKLVIVGGTAFAVSPLNLPGYIPVLGQLDDLGIILFVGNVFFKQIPPDVMEQHKLAVGLHAWTGPVGAAR